MCSVCRTASSCRSCRCCEKADGSRTSGLFFGAAPVKAREKLSPVHPKKRVVRFRHDSGKRFGISGPYGFAEVRAAGRPPADACKYLLAEPFRSSGDAPGFAFQHIGLFVDRPDAQSGGMDKPSSPAFGISRQPPVPLEEGWNRVEYEQVKLVKLEPIRDNSVGSDSAVDKPR